MAAQSALAVGADREEFRPDMPQQLIPLLLRCFFLSKQVHIDILLLRHLLQPVKCQRTGTGKDLSVINHISAQIPTKDALIENFLGLLLRSRRIHYLQHVKPSVIVGGIRVVLSPFGGNARPFQSLACPFKIY